MSRFDHLDFGRYMGDARRCPVHPRVVTSSANGMFDAPCPACEAVMDMPSREELAALAEETVEDPLPDVKLDTGNPWF